MSLSGVFRGTAVVAAVFVGTLAASLTYCTIPDLIFLKTCSSSDDPGHDFISKNESLIVETKVFVLTRAVLRNVLQSLSTPLFAVWRDITGHSRPLVVIGELAEAFGGLIYIGAALDSGMSPWVPIITESAYTGLFGESVLQLGALCIVVENSDVGGRTLRIQFYTTAIFLASSVGRFAYSYLKKGIPIVLILVISTLLHIGSITLILIFVKNKESKAKRGKCECGKFCTPGTNCPVVWMMLLSSGLLTSLFTIEEIKIKSYLQHEFHFTTNEEVTFMNFRSLVPFIGSVMFPFVFIKVLKWTDFKIGIACSAICTMACVVISNAATRAQLYILTLLDVFNWVLYSTPNALISKCVSEDNLGSFIGQGKLLQCFLLFLLHILYSTVDINFTSMQGAFFLVTAVVECLVLILFSISCWVYKPIENFEVRNSDDEEIVPTYYKKKDDTGTKVDVTTNPCLGH